MRRHPNAGVGRSWLLKTVIRWIEALLRAVCAMQRDCVHGCPTAEGCVLAALCARERVAGCTVCAAGLQQSVQGSRGCRGRSVRKDGKTALILAAGLTRRLPLSWLLAKRRQASATQMALLL